MNRSSAVVRCKHCHAVLIRQAYSKPIPNPDKLKSPKTGCWVTERGVVTCLQPHSSGEVRTYEGERMAFMFHVPVIENLESVSKSLDELMRVHGS